MALSLYDLSVETFAPTLGTLSTLLDKGADHARAGGKDPDSLTEARLAPDMFPLARQVQIACDQAKNGSAMLAGVEPPKFEDNEKTIAELKARIAKTVDYLKTLDAAAFAGAETRKVSLPLLDPLVWESNGLEYLRDWALPHFYFHIVTAYDILRHEGVQIGKRDYMAHVGRHIRAG